MQSKNDEHRNYHPDTAPSKGKQAPWFLHSIIKKKCGVVFAYLVFRNQSLTLTWINKIKLIAMV
jgi:hypothetical protein